MNTKPKNERKYENEEQREELLGHLRWTLLSIANRRIRKGVEELSDLTPLEFVELVGGSSKYINSKDTSHAGVFVAMLSYSCLGLSQEMAKRVEANCGTMDDDMVNVTFSEEWLESIIVDVMKEYIEGR